MFRRGCMAIGLEKYLGVVLIKENLCKLDIISRSIGRKKVLLCFSLQKSLNIVIDSCLPNKFRGKLSGKKIYSC